MDPSVGGKSFGHLSSPTEGIDLEFLSEVRSCYEERGQKQWIGLKLLPWVSELGVKGPGGKTAT